MWRYSSLSLFIVYFCSVVTASSLAADPLRHIEGPFGIKFAQEIVHEGSDPDAE